jgi:hypothetical protein
MPKMMDRLRQFRETLPYRFMPKLAELSARVATSRIASKLSLSGPKRLLLDSTIQAHAITHEEAWIDTGDKLWGGKVRVSCGNAARIPVHSAANQSREYADICYITGIAYLARRGLLSLHTSSELMAEQDRQPPARFRAVTYAGMSLLDGIDIESVDGWSFDWLIGGLDSEKPNLAELQRQRLAASNDRLFRDLMRIFGNEKHSQDAWHIRTAEAHHCAAFITMDYSLLRLIENRQKHLDTLGMTTQVLSPKQFGNMHGIEPLPPYLFSYDNSSFPVRSDVCWPDERRRSTRRREKN